MTISLQTAHEMCSVPSAPDAPRIYRYAWARRVLPRQSLLTFTLFPRVVKSLEQRVAELEEENDGLRAALNLPPVNRPPLGRGPTGKDKVKPFGSRTRSLDGPSTGLEEGSQSPQTSSSSPHSTSLTMSSVTPGEAQDVSSWEQSLSMPQDDYMDRDRVHSSAPPTSTSHASTSSAFSSDSQGYRFDYNSRASLPNALYLSPNPASYAHSSDRPSTSSSTLSRDNPFSYNSPALQSTHGSSNHMRGLPSPPSGVSHHLDGSLGESMSPQAQGMTYGLRRSLTEPQTFNTFVDNFPHVPYPQQTQHSLRLSQSSRLPSNHPSTCTRYNGPEGSIEPSSSAPRTS